MTDAPRVARYLATFVMTALATVVTVGLDREVTIPNLSLIYVLPVVAAGVIFGLGPSLFSAVLGALAYNFFLTEPRYSLIVNDPANVWAIGLLFVVGCIASTVASIARRKADDAILLRRQMAILQTCSRDITAAEDTKAIASIAADILEAIFEVPVVVVDLSEGVAQFVERRGNVQLTEIEIEAARSTLTTGEHVTAGIYPFDVSRFDFWPVTTRDARHMIVGLAFLPLQRPSDPSTLVDVVRGLLALALDCQRAGHDG
ncbi:DUF4118 domain-containing protein [Rhizobium calliandrae]|uniref:DUF4118 domain-containing protein n=1 Tax=Rhizobium calliandrae TaxID=1312182 RepID=A0ABT7KJ20_9HYPH|nr:DUF4118 domain-containing protein [Rhizobium calliandrae]MDL2408624.1 DUF4118 domain-containing protein [Rhizobium calliandrae]